MRKNKKAFKLGTKTEFEKAFKTYTSENNRRREESFLRGITGNYGIRLAFTSNACTDGKLIQICPDKRSFNWIKSIQKANRFFKCENLFSNWFSWLRFYNRGTGIHEAGHIIFSQETFQELRKCNKLARYTNSEKQIISQISNIIEDAFIERALCVAFAGAKKYLSYSNVVTYYEINENRNQEKEPLSAYLFYMMHIIILNKKPKKCPDEIKEYVDATLPMFLEARVEPDGKTRFDYAYKILKEIKDLIPPVPVPEDNLPSFSSNASNNYDNKDENSCNSSSSNGSSNSMPKITKEQLKNCDIGTDTADDNSSVASEAKLENKTAEKQEKSVSEENEKDEQAQKKTSETDEQATEVLKNEPLHSNFNVEITTLESDDYSRLKYSELFCKNIGVIKAFVTKFKRMLEIEEGFEEGLEMGSSSF